VLDDNSLTILIEDVNVQPYILSSTAGTGMVTPGTVDILTGILSYTLQVTVTVPATITKPLDVLFIEDLSGSFGDDLLRVQVLVPNMIASIQVENYDVFVHPLLPGCVVVVVVCLTRCPRGVFRIQELRCCVLCGHPNKPVWVCVRVVLSHRPTTDSQHRACASCRGWTGDAEWQGLS